MSSQAVSSSLSPAVRRNEIVDKSKSTFSEDFISLSSSSAGAKSTVSKEIKQRVPSISRTGVNLIDLEKSSKKARKAEARNSNVNTLQPTSRSLQSLQSLFGGVNK
jgi:hypothetical protein